MFDYDNENLVCTQQYTKTIMNALLTDYLCNNRCCLYRAYVFMIAIFNLATLPFKYQQQKLKIIQTTFQFLSKH